jgi:GT2 family glycosyltransferase
VTTAPAATVVICVYTDKRWGDIVEAVESVAAQDVPATETIVLVDHNDALLSRAEQAFGPRGVRVLPNAHAQGLSGGRNTAIAAATGDVVVFLDDDVSLPKDLFAKLARIYAAEDVVGATGWVIEPHAQRLGGPRSILRRLVLPGSRRQPGRFTRYGYPHYVVVADGPCDVEFMPGCFMSARRRAAAEVRFDEHLGAYALAEDEDFSYRLSRLGRVVYLPDVVVVHEKLGFRSFDSRDFGRLVVKNRAYLFRKNFPQTPRARFQFGLLLAKMVGHRLLNREWRGALGVLEGTLNLVRGRS